MFYFHFLTFLKIFNEQIEHKLKLKYLNVNFYLLSIIDLYIIIILELNQYDTVQLPLFFRFFQIMSQSRQQVDQKKGSFLTEGKSQLLAHED